MGDQHPTHILGLDIGSNSVGSAWVNRRAKQVYLAASVFPAGVDEKEGQRGAPKNQARRQTRGQRRTIDRRARRKRLLIKTLVDTGFLPRDAKEFDAVIVCDPWQLRVKALTKQITPYEFGRICLHMAQRRGAAGINIVMEDEEGGETKTTAKKPTDDEGKIKAGMKRLDAAMKEANVETVAVFIDKLARERTTEKGGVSWREPIRNRLYRLPEDQQFYAGRDMIRKEFYKIVEAQQGFADSPLAAMLTADFIAQLDQPKGDATWKNSGLLFGQRRIYWDMGTLGRCDLEPTERCVPLADRHASYYRVVETVNNIKIVTGDGQLRPLCRKERDAVIDTLRGPLFKKSKGKLVPKASASVTDIKEALGIKRNDKWTRLNIEADEKREINTDWFHREIAHGAFGEDRWAAMDERQRESVNRAILKFDPEDKKHAPKLRQGGMDWWRLDEAAADRLVAAWLRRPKLEKRLNMSRRAILNLLPIMETFDEKAERWPTQQEARKRFAKTLDDPNRAQRYATGAAGLTSRDRYYMKLDKHRIAENLPALPPAPTLSNPVVRKAIHEVRRHVIEWMRIFGKKPERIVIEMARETKDSEKKRNEALSRNSFRNAIRTKIVEETLPMAFGEEGAHRLTLNQRRKAEDRVLLARMQKHTCPYCGAADITDVEAAKGDGFEIDHIAPYSKTGDNGLNNKVVVHTNCNRGKTNKTPREWWGDSFDERIVVAARLFDIEKPDNKDYFRKEDYKRKWQNFTRDISEDGEWRTSQLTDTAYAAKQVAAYLADALYDGRGLPERGDGSDAQRIFFTQGRFTNRLRKDWQLFETVTASDEIGTPDTTTAEERLKLAQKDRGDHRQHAIDAVVIALTDPGIKNYLAKEAKDQAEFKEFNGKWQRPTPIPVPWGEVADFRLAVLGQVYPHLSNGGNRGEKKFLLVSHRAVKRRLVGAFHKQTQYGPVMDSMGNRVPDRVTIRQPIYDSPRSHIKPKHLRLPSPESDDEAKRRITEDLVLRRHSKGDAQKIANRLVASGEFRRKLVDPTPGKTGIVRDRSLRRLIRSELEARGLNPDQFTAGQLKAAIDANGPLRQKSGIPIKSAVLLWANNDPVVITRKKTSIETGKRTPIDDPRTLRIHDGQNNHHVAIRASGKSGKWGGEIVPTFVVAQRLSKRQQALIEIDRAYRHLRRGLTPHERAGLSIEVRRAEGERRKREWKQAMKELKPRRATVIAAHPLVDRTDNDKSTFVMSLAEGEMIYARRHDRPGAPADYFVVRQLNRNKRGGAKSIELVAHWDARKKLPSKEKKKGGDLSRFQDRWVVSPAQLASCGPEPGTAPQKVRVSPLGKVTILEKD